jgi:hypothetical protein
MEYNMQEKRHSPRKVADQVLEIHDQVTGNYLGSIVNISVEGFMLLSQEPITIGSVYQLSLIIPSSQSEKKPIRFGAEAIWYAEATQPDSYWNGFRIIDIANDDELYIDQLILNWHNYGSTDN